MRYKFKVGDTVKISDGYLVHGGVHLRDKVATILHQHKLDIWFVQTNNENATGYVDERDMVLIEEKLENKSTKNMSISKSIKQLFRSEPEKTFVEAGFMDNNEELTAKGKEALEYLLWEEKKDKLKELADKILAEEKE